MQKIARPWWLAGLLALVGCKSEYQALHYVPDRVEAPVEFRDRPEARAVAAASVHGIRRANRESGRPELVEVELSVENTGAVPLEWMPGRTRLEDRDRRSFGTPEVRAVRSESRTADARSGEETADLRLRLEPGKRAESCLAFPPAAGEIIDGLDASELRLGWTLSFDGGRSVDTSVTFGRVEGFWSDGALARGSLGATCW